MLQNIKKVVALAMLATISISSIQAQNEAGKQKLKKHQCTKACTKDKHMYQHGEKGHKCDVSCKPKTTTTTVQLKDHVCTDACHKAGKCVIVHGEKGHTCDANCKKS